MMTTNNISSSTLMTAVCGGTAVLTLWKLYKLTPKMNGMTEDTRQIVSSYVEFLAESPPLRPETQRSQFTTTNLIPRKPVKGHTHGVSAANRSAASCFADRFAEDLGLDPYFVQCSRSDQRVGRQGSRSMFWAKDLIVKVNPFDPGESKVLVLIDVDYYVDMPKMMIDEFRPILLYTFQPDCVSKVVDEYSYTFNANNEVVYKVSGGGSYQHQVWNYGQDHVFVQKKFLGMTYRSAAYLIDRRRVCDDHDLVSLTPVKRWTGFGALLSSFLSGKILERLKPVEGEYLRMYSQEAAGLYVSTGKVGHFASAKMRADYDDAVAISARTTTVKLSLPTVLSYVEGEDLQERKVKASAVLDYHRNKAEGVKASKAYIFPVEESIRSYDFGVASFDPDAKRTLTPFMSPLIHGAFAPLLSKANEEAAISGRVTSIAVKKGSLVMTEFMDKTMREFTRFLVPDAHAMEPVDLDDVYERQSRPTQRRILESSLNEDPNRVVKSFIKKEAYGDIKDPRVISTINGVDKREYSRYIYPLADLIKTQKWYAFGVTPVEIATRVCDTLEDASTAINSDFSRFDGRVSDLIREMEKMVLVRAFHRDYTHDVLELHNSQYNQPAVATLRTKYNTGFSRASGSPETAAFNSLTNAYTAYLAFRMTRENGGFISPEEAWERLGLYGGDDGLTADIDPVKYVRAATLLGSVLEIDVIQRGCLGITFLSRQYGPNVWFGDRNSCCDLPRQLAKLHTTANLPPGVSAKEKLLEKCRSYFLTDNATPILGAFVTKAVELNGILPEMTEKTQLMRRWNSFLPESVQYPNLDEGWMGDYAMRALEPFGFDMSLFEAWIDSVDTLDDLMNPPLCAEPKAVKAKARVIVDEDVIEQTVVQEKKSRTKSSKKSTKKPRGRKRGSRSSSSD